MIFSLPPGTDPELAAGVAGAGVSFAFFDVAPAGASAARLELELAVAVAVAVAVPVFFALLLVAAVTGFAVVLVSFSLLDATLSLSEDAGAAVLPSLLPAESIPPASVHFSSRGTA
eukprot:CAMPEP_0194758584 /NCGR_PEP_ID=MMETSP0323_2-20130528/11824_1 /TAXON_ID=2866 ORGANISM="Crypthecodinium cohnii, Strain Seligo" /NCGR_SAMPLE_ID=MMETSP0323_2 /ASSEMBLY_ACC=CAM_ASM_000346 /LENGTH=115 /DNA_ID=CAMNT_0039678971 /DNA_START=298 /DNA_END=645 /DNA_ORIENTATION=-